MEQYDKLDTKLVVESDKTKKARDKLKKQFEEIEKQITPEALKQKSLEIHRWIARHAHNRVILKNKNISLFDENQNTATFSQCVSTISRKLITDHCFFTNTKVKEEVN